MTADATELKNAVAALTAALTPLQSLVESMSGLNKSHRIQADLQLIEQCCSKAERETIFGAIDDALAADQIAEETLMANVKRRSDQRTYEQFAAAHGDDAAKKAFTSDEDVTVMREAAKSKLSELKRKHPVFFRVHAYLNNGW